MERARTFYEDVLGLKPIFTDARLRAYGVASRSVLLIFRRGAATETVAIPGGTIPGHDGSGPLHIAFAIGKDELATWELHLASRGVAIEGATSWSRGGRSIYFRDPDGHLLELATPGLWSVY
jgi:catechol 2,3-dioxygenase-like lactoylglutathione lyase family enzyme